MPDNSSPDILARIDERKTLANKLRLPSKLFAIFREISRYPQYMKLPDWPLLRLCEVEELTVIVTDDRESVRCRLGNNGYELTCTKFHFSNTEYDSGVLSLKDDSGNLLFETVILVTRDLEWHTTDQRASDEIMAFIPGDWVDEFLRCYESFAVKKLENDRKQRLKEQEARKEELKKRFGLD